MVKSLTKGELADMSVREWEKLFTNVTGPNNIQYQFQISVTYPTICLVFIYIQYSPPKNKAEFLFQKVVDMWW